MSFLNAVQVRRYLRDNFKEMFFFSFLKASKTEDFKIKIRS